jgi:hypothetical protein
LQPIARHIDPQSRPIPGSIRPDSLFPAAGILLSLPRGLHNWRNGIHNSALARGRLAVAKILIVDDDVAVQTMIRKALAG